MFQGIKDWFKRYFDINSEDFDRVKVPQKPQRPVWVTPDEYIERVPPTNFVNPETNESLPIGEPITLSHNGNGTWDVIEPEVPALTTEEVNVEATEAVESTPVKKARKKRTSKKTTTKKKPTAKKTTKRKSKET